MGGDLLQTHPSPSPPQSSAARVREPTQRGGTLCAGGAAAAERRERLEPWRRGRGAPRGLSAACRLQRRPARGLSRRRGNSPRRLRAAVAAAVRSLCGGRILPARVRKMYPPLRRFAPRAGRGAERGRPRCEPPRGTGKSPL